MKALLALGELYVEDRKYHIPQQHFQEHFHDIVVSVERPSSLILYGEVKKKLHVEEKGDGPFTTVIRMMMNRHIPRHSPTQA